MSRGGINAAARGSMPEAASEAALPETGLDHELAEAEAAIPDAKRAYYATLDRRHRALRAKKGGLSE